MDDWFDDLEIGERPGKEELQSFLRRLLCFLGDVVERHEFDFLWEEDFELRELARGSLEEDVERGFEELSAALREADEESLRSHGLIGLSLRFKLRVVKAIGKKWKRVRHHFVVRGWFKQMCDAIDSVLDSLIQVAGAGGVVKEFKDALSALAIVE